MAAEAHGQVSLGRRIGVVLLALVNLAGATVVGFFGLLADGLRCDDNCSVAPGWRNDPNAWQWHGSLLLSLVILGSALVLALTAFSRHSRPLRSVAVGVQLTAALFLGVLASTANGSQGGWGALIALLAFFAFTGVGVARSA
jgi:hypothetical protein